MLLYGLIGKKLSHSFSKQYFTHKFETLQLPFQYELFELSEIESFKTLNTHQPQLKGLNVTIPYKSEIISYLEELDREAQKVGAVNTLKKLPNGGWKGYNTDIYGFQKSLENFGGHRLSKAIILGTGGAAKAVEYVLTEKLAFQQVVKISRQKQEDTNMLTYQQLNEVDLQHQLIINCTPIGMYPNLNDMPTFPFENLDNTNYVMDLIYNPAETLFLKSAKERGAKTFNGYEMLVLQAERAYEIWTS